MLREKIVNKKAYLGLAGAAAIIVMASPSNPFAEGHSYTDSSVFRYVAYEILGGGIPYVDTFDHKGPLIYLINVLGMKVGFTHGIWILELFSLCLTLWLSYYWLKKYAKNNLTAVFSVIVTYSFLTGMFDGGNTVEEWALPFLAFSGFCFWEYYQKQQVSFGKIFLTGFCCGCVLMMRPNMIVLWAVNGAAVTIGLILSRQWKYAIWYIISFLSGCLAVVLPILFYLFKNHALEAFWDCYILFNIRYTGAQWLEKIKATLYFINKPQIYVSAAVLIYGYFYSKDTGIKKGVTMAALTLLASLLSVGMSGRYYFHYQIVLLPVLLLPVYMLVSQCRVKQKKYLSIDHVILALLSIFMVSNFSIAVQNYAEMMGEEGRNARIYDISQYIMEHTDPQERITVMGNEDILYLRSRRKSASRYSYQVPILFEDEEILEEYFDDIQNNLPQIVVITDQMDGSPELVERMFEFCANNNYNRLSIDETILFHKN